MLFGEKPNFLPDRPSLVCLHAVKHFSLSGLFVARDLYSRRMLVSGKWLASSANSVA